MRRLLLLLLFFPGLAPAVGTDAEVRWTRPSAYTDGNQLLPEEIFSYTIHFTKGGVKQTVEVMAPAVATTIPVSCESTRFIVSVTTTKIALHPSMTSSSSGPVPFVSGVTCGGPISAAPTNLRIQ